MPNQSILAVPLGELTDGQEADFFAILSGKEELKTRDGKPYFRVTFRDAQREVGFPIWGDSAWAVDCRDHWTLGEFYKLRAIYRETSYGPQLDIRKVRAVVEADADDGFDPKMCKAATRFDTDELFAELMSLAETFHDEDLATLVTDILRTHQEALLTIPAATRNHHAFLGGWLEHTVSVVRTCQYLADKYDDYYPNMEPRLNKEILLAGAILHDIGKLRELEEQPEGAIYSAAGNLIGHILQGRDILREAAAHSDINPETLLRVEHIIVSHQRLPEWGSPKPPMTPEALLVHYADDIDAKYHMMAEILRNDTNAGPLTSKKNALHQMVFRGEGYA